MRKMFPNKGLFYFFQNKEKLPFFPYPTFIKYFFTKKGQIEATTKPSPISLLPDHDSFHIFNRKKYVTFRQTYRS